SRKQAKHSKSPGLRIKIENSSFVEDGLAEHDLDLLAKSPTLHISGISICRSPGAGAPSPQMSPASPSFVESLRRSGHGDSSRCRSSSLIVPPPQPITPIWSGHTPPNTALPPYSPGSRSLHLSRISSPAPLISAFPTSAPMNTALAKQH